MRRYSIIFQAKVSFYGGQRFIQKVIPTLAIECEHGGVYFPSTPYGVVVNGCRSFSERGLFCHLYQNFGLSFIYGITDFTQTIDFQSWKLKCSSSYAYKFTGAFQGYQAA